jgi:hypothetical protein
VQGTWRQVLAGMSGGHLCFLSAQASKWDSGSIPALEMDGGGPGSAALGEDLVLGSCLPGRSCSAMAGA